MVLSCALVEMRTMGRWWIILKDLGANHKEYFGPLIFHFVFPRLFRIIIFSNS
jgi:hypothetical protein